MFKFIRKIKELYNLSDRIYALESQIIEMDQILKKGFDSSLKEFEKKIQEMTFAYTANLDDTKSDYLKRYVEQRLEGMQHQLTQLPYKIDRLTSKILELENKELMDDA